MNTGQRGVTVDRAHHGSAPLARVRVVVIDDRQLLANALGITLRTDPELDVVGIYPDLDEATRFVCQTPPDVLVIDYFTFTYGGGAALVSTLRLHSPETKILVLTQHEDQQTLLTCIRNGADGNLTNQSPPGALIDAVKRVHAGDVLYPSVVLAELLIEPQSRRAVTNGSARPLLLPRELAVLQGISDGLTTDEVATQFGIRVYTVRAHLRSVLAKLGARSRLEAVLIGLRTGLIKLSE